MNIPDVAVKNANGSSNVLWSRRWSGQYAPGGYQVPRDDELRFGLVIAGYVPRRVLRRRVGVPVELAAPQRAAAFGIGIGAPLACRLAALGRRAAIGVGQVKLACPGPGRAERR